MTKFNGYVALKDTHIIIVARDNIKLGVKLSFHIPGMVQLKYTRGCVYE